MDDRLLRPKSIKVKAVVHHADGTSHNYGLVGEYTQTDSGLMLPKSAQEQPEREEDK